MELATERLRLREYTPEDFAALREIHGDARVQAMRGGEVLTKQETRDEITYVLAAQREEPRLRYQFIIELAAEQRGIGYCRLTRKTPLWNRAAEIGYFLHADAWGQGYATEAAQALLRLGFEQLALHRISARCWAANRGSVRVLEKLGMQREARIRQERQVNGVWADTLIYAILEHEWPDND